MSVKQMRFFRERNWIAPIHVNIGVIIEFLGDDIDEITNLKGRWHINTSKEESMGEELFDVLYTLFINKINEEIDRKVA